MNAGAENEGRVSDEFLEFDDAGWYCDLERDEEEEGKSEDEDVEIFVVMITMVSFFRVGESDVVRRKRGGANVFYAFEPVTRKRKRRFFLYGWRSDREVMGCLPFGPRRFARRNTRCTRRPSSGIRKRCVSSFYTTPMSGV